MINFTCVVTLRENGEVVINAPKTMTQWMTHWRYKVKGTIIRHNDPEFNKENENNTKRGH